jgi:hypothetical protein
MVWVMHHHLNSSFKFAKFVHSSFKFELEPKLKPKLAKFVHSMSQQGQAVTTLLEALSVAVGQESWGDAEQCAVEMARWVPAGLFLFYIILCYSYLILNMCQPQCISLNSFWPWCLWP